MLCAKQQREFAMFAAVCGMLVLGAVAAAPVYVGFYGHSADCSSAVAAREFVNDVCAVGNAVSEKVTCDATTANSTWVFNIYEGDEDCGEATITVTGNGTACFKVPDEEKSVIVDCSAAVSAASASSLLAIAALAAAMAYSGAQKHV